MLTHGTLRSVQCLVFHPCTQRSDCHYPVVCQRRGDSRLTPIPKGRADPFEHLMLRILDTIRKGRDNVPYQRVYIDAAVHIGGDTWLAIPRSLLIQSARPRGDSATP